MRSALAPLVPAGISHRHSSGASKALTPLAGPESNLGDPGCYPSNRAKAGGHLIFAETDAPVRGNKSFHQPEANVLTSPYHAGTWFREATPSFYPCSGAHFSIVVSIPGFWEASWATGYLPWADS